MRAVFERVGWRLVATLRQFDRDWVMYALTRAEWRPTV
jgi:RimJ/RimL family protein N-acetyltransferase